MFPNHILPKNYAASDKSETISGSQSSKFQMSTDSVSLWGMATTPHRALGQFLRVF